MISYSQLATYLQLNLHACIMDTVDIHKFPNCQSTLGYASVKYAQKFAQNAFRNFPNDMKITLFDSIYVFQCILNVLLECIELFNTVHMYFICTNCSIREYRSDFSPLCIMLV